MNPIHDGAVRALERIREREALSSGVSARSVHTTLDIQSSLFAHTLEDIRAAFERELAARGEPDLAIARQGRPYRERCVLGRSEGRGV